jgi:hypothetical protein
MALVALRFDTFSSGASFLTGDPAVLARLLKYDASLGSDWNWDALSEMYSSSWSSRSFFLRLS